MSVLTESEDEDLHQCGRCRAMFRRLADYFAHKKHKSCQRHLDSAVQTSPTHLANDVETVDCQTSGDSESTDLANVVRQSLRDWLDDDQLIGDDCLHLPPSACDEPDSVEASDPATDNTVIPLSTITEDVSRSSSADEQDVVAVTDTASNSEHVVHVVDEALTQDHSDVSDVLTEKVPEAPPPHQCPQCSYTSKFRDDFDQHLRCQHGLSSHVCVDCSRAFTDVYKLRRHQRLYCTKTPVRNK